MILDGLLSFNTVGTPQALTSTTAPSTNVIDLLNARDMGVGDDPALKLAIFVGTAGVSAGGATLTIQAQGSTDNSTYTTYAESRAYSAADLAAGNKLFPIDWPHRGPGDALPRYLRLNYSIATSTFSALAIDAKLVLDRQDSTTYPPGLGISN